MGISTIIYIASVVASLYATYLIAYRLYDVPSDWDRKHDGKKPERIFLPRIVYLILLIVAFIPIVNGIALLVFVIVILIGKSCGDFQVKSWLFESAGEEKEEEKE